MNHIEAYPLQWPDGWPRSKHRVPSQFQTSFANARDGLLDEVRLMGGKQPVISSNVPLRQDGLPKASYRRVDDPGVAVYFTLKGEPRVFACDRWLTVEDNLQAIRKTIEALRGIERWGSSEMLNRVFRGFAALPEASAEPSWGAVLGVPSSWPLEQIEARYRELARLHHPDRGGSPKFMAQLNAAIAAARAEKGKL